MSDTTTIADPGADVTIALARSVLGGKRSARVEARVTDELKFELQRRCHEIGITESDYLERLLSVSLFGLEHVQMIEQERIRQVCGMSGVFPQKAGQ